MKSVEDQTEDWYREYYSRKGGDRNDLLTNAGVLFQHLAFEDSIISVLRSAAGLRRETAGILDVGCGTGASLAMFLQLGFEPGNLYGIDLLEQRIAEGCRKYPGFNLVCNDAVSMPFESDRFDLVFESTMFVQITDESLSGKIAQEMMRVTKPGGYVMLNDWRYGKPGNPNYLAVSTSRIRKMFSVGSRTDLLCQRNGALVPPVGRFVSKYLPASYFLLRAMLPFLAGSNVTLLQKRMA